MAPKPPTLRPPRHSRGAPRYSDGLSADHGRLDVIALPRAAMYADPARARELLHVSASGAPDLEMSGSSGNSVGRRVEVETAAVEVDRGFEVLAIAEPVGALLDRL